jgi:hypothetical protein
LSSATLPTVPFSHLQRIARPRQRHRALRTPTLPVSERRHPMPAKTEKQRRFMGAELERKREGKKTRRT